MKMNLNLEWLELSFLVTNLMRQMGYKPVGSASLPSQCVANTGQLFRRDKAREPVL